jgi:hypothetical protein
MNQLEEAVLDFTSSSFRVYWYFGLYCSGIGENCLKQNQMNKQLRKRHRVIWFFIAAIIPFLLLVSWLLIPQLEPVKAVAQSQPGALPVVLKTLELPNHYEANLRTNNRGDYQLEWRSYAALRIPAVIYQLKDNGKQFLIGRIEARGIYRFPVQSDSTSNDFRFQLYDFIHERVIDTINIRL